MIWKFTFYNSSFTVHQTLNKLLFFWLFLFSFIFFYYFLSLLFNLFPFKYFFFSLFLSFGVLYKHVCYLFVPFHSFFLFLFLFPIFLFYFSFVLLCSPFILFYPFLSLLFKHTLYITQNTSVLMYLSFPSFFLLSFCFMQTCLLSLLYDLSCSFLFFFPSFFLVFIFSLISFPLFFFYFPFSCSFSLKKKIFHSTFFSSYHFLF